MPTFKIRTRIKKIFVLNNPQIVIVIIVVCSVMIVLIYYSQKWSEETSLPPIVTTSPKEEYEIAKLAAEIRQIRGDTSGSLFWLKMFALFVTVGGAVGGYLVGQSRVAKRRIDFENRKNVDAVYQAIVQELSDKAPLLRAAAAVKLGAILKSFPSEWGGDQPRAKEREEQLIQLTKQVLAASLAIEKDPKVLKTLSIALVLHKRLVKDPGTGGRKKYANGRELDLSGAKADDAFWAKVDFSYSDFFRADLTRASLRGSILQTAQFRQTKLCEAVLADADCEGANFKLADLRNADLTNANLKGTSFENAKVHGCKLVGAVTENNPDCQVDDSPEGDGKVLIKLRDWLKRAEVPRDGEASTTTGVP
jgi:hypothetical protein